MLVKRFLAWVQTAPADARATGTAALARAFLGPDLDEREKGDAAAALMLMLDDPEPVVRRAMAEVLADAPDAPRHVVLALAADVPEVALPILARSPIPGEADLVDGAATGGVAVQCAIAGRPELPPPVAAALAEVAEDRAIVRLLRNAGAVIPDFSLVRIAERFGGDDGVAETLLARSDLPVMGRFAVMEGRFLRASSDPVPDRARRDACEKAIVAAAANLPDDELGLFVRQLRQRAALTASLLLRVVVMGRTDLFHGVLAELSGMPLRRVAAIAVERRGLGFQALCRKVGLPAGIIPVYRAALSITGSAGAGDGSDLPGLPPGLVLSQLMRSDAVRSLPADDPLLHALQRLEGDLARDEARRMAQALLPDLRQEPLLLQPSMVVEPGPMHQAIVQDNDAGSPAEAWPMASPETVTPAAPVAPPEEDEAPAPSFAAMAALLEETVAAALANLPPPAPRKDDWRELARKAPVIEGEWVGVAVERGFDPGQFRQDVAA